MSIKRNELYIPHQAIVFAQQDNICDFSLDKVGYAYQNRESNIGHEDALWKSIQQMAVICYVKAAHMVRAIMSNALHMNRFVDLCKKIVNMI